MPNATGQDAVKEAVKEAREVCKGVFRLNKQLRGTDLLAEQVKQMKHQIKGLERTVDRLCSSS